MDTSEIIDNEVKIGGVKPDTKAQLQASAERALQALEGAAVRMIDTFPSKAVSDTLHIIAKSRYCLLVN
jgi:hypothetical protein